MTTDFFEEHHISIGSDCAIAYQLRKHRVNCIAYPFDWLKCDMIESIILILKDNFSNFYNNNNFIIKKQSNNFLNMEQDIISEYKIIIKPYNITLPHEFTLSNFDYTIYKTKYERRIERFINIIKDKNIKKVLIRSGTTKTLSNDMICKLKEELDKFGAVNYRIKIVNYDMYEIDNFTWKRDYIDWYNIFMN